VLRDTSITTTQIAFLIEMENKRVVRILLLLAFCSICLLLLIQLARFFFQPQIVDSIVGTVKKTENADDLYGTVGEVIFNIEARFAMVAIPALVISAILIGILFKKSNPKK